MKTKSIAQAGMLCALYGVFLLANTFTGLVVESAFPFIFAIPILVCALKEPRNISLCALAAMIVLSFLLGNFTTWVIGISNLMAGWIFGNGIHQRKPMLTTSLWCLGVLCLSNYLQMNFWATLFGFSGQEDYGLIRQILPISWQSFLLFSSFLFGLLETVSIGCLAIIVTLKVYHYHFDFSYLFGFHLSLPKWFLFFFLLWTTLWLTNLYAPFLPRWADDLLFLGFGVCLVLLIYKGCEGLVQKAKRSKKKWLVSLALCSAFLPPLCFFDALYGLGILFQETTKEVKASHSK